MKFEIKNKFNGSIIFSIETTSFNSCVAEAVKNSADLRSADLRYADLRSIDLYSADLSYADLRYSNLSYADLSSADLSYADLRYSNLSYADLSSADLSYANLRFANLSSANLSSADLRSIDLRYANLMDIKNSELALAQFNICPTEGAFVGWKKLKGNLIARLVIPDGAQRINSIGSRKCRASKVFVDEIFGATEAYDSHNGKLLYKTGQEVISDKFDNSITSECSNGIHFFLSRIEAENY